MELVQAGSVRVLFVMAASPEYGPNLQALFRPLICGVGPVEAAIAVTRALVDVGPDGPDLVVSLGSAGSARLTRSASTCSRRSASVRAAMLSIKGYKGAEGEYNFDANGDGLHGYNVVKNEKGTIVYDKHIDFND